MSGIPNEQILVVPTELLHELGYFQGFCPGADRYLDMLFSEDNTSYRPRAEMEGNPNFKQLIPYVIFCYRDENGQPSLFCYTRGTGQGEKRLHCKQSVGIGGHISSDDAASHAPYAVGMRRELNEEVIIGTRYTEQCVGLINDDETDVGKVHLGVVHVFDVETMDVRPREAEIMDAAFRPLSDLLANLGGFETWSQICLQGLFANRR